MFLVNLNTILLILICLIIILVIIGSFMTRYFKRYNQVKKIEEILKSYTINENYSFSKFKDKCYNYKLELKYNIFYIKLLYVKSNKDLIINNVDDWYIRDFEKDNKYRLNNINEFINLEVNSEGIKRVKKIFLIYPDVSNIIKYINSYESEFVYPQTDIYGCNIMIKKDLLNKDIFD